MNRTLVWVLVAVAVVLVTVAVVLVVRRRRYIGALRSRGWVFESSPALASVLDHQAPPFGLGFERLLAWITGVHHLREVIPFPRLLTRMYP